MIVLKEKISSHHLNNELGRKVIKETLLCWRFMQESMKLLECSACHNAAQEHIDEHEIVIFCCCSSIYF